MALSLSGALVSKKKIESESPNCKLLQRAAMMHVCAALPVTEVELHGDSRGQKTEFV